MNISTSVLNSNKRVSRCQQNFKDSIVIPEIRENPEEYFYLLSKTEICIFKQLCIQKQKYNIFRISQGLLALRCRVTREYVNKVLKKFESVGILKMWYHHKATSHYRLSSFFTNQIIASLSYLWRAIPLTFLLSQPALETTNTKSSQYIKGTELLNTKYLVLSDSRSKERELRLPSNTRFLKKETVMQADLTQLDFDYLKSIKPTLAGKVKLSAYPVEIVKQVDDQLFKMTKQINNPWAYFNTTCATLCKQNNIEPNWSTMYKLSTLLGIPVIAPFNDSTFVPEKIVTSSVKKTRVSSVNLYEHNMAIVKEYAVHLLENKQSKQTIEQELEELKITDSKRYEWRKKYQHDMLVACGRDPVTGDALPHFDQKIAAVVLNKALGTTFAEPILSDEYEEVYDLFGVDPFGNRN